MQDHQRDFVDFLMEAEALQFGEFTLKSGRVSPLFFNAGRLDTGPRIARLGEAYAATILGTVGADGFDVVFGPAYKGIPLAVATVLGLAKQGISRAYLADRKEAKAHGAEAAGGVAKMLLGRVPADGSRFVLVDDVLTTGGTKDEAVAFLKEICPGATFPALLIVLDRQETTPDGQDAVQGFTDRTGIPVEPVLRLSEVVDDLAARGRVDAATADRCRTYWREHGTAAARAWAGDDA
jgi:orotate phosphoribosyltransferase